MTDAPKHSHGWTVDTLKDHLESLGKERDCRYSQRFDAQEKAVNAALAAAERAVNKAEMATEKRMDSVNEFRGTLSDQQRNLMPRAEVMVMFAAVNEKIDSLTKAADALMSERTGIKGGWGYAVGVIGLVMLVASIIAIAAKLVT